MIGKIEQEDAESAEVFLLRELCVLLFKAESDSTGSVSFPAKSAKKWVCKLSQLFVITHIR